jgi:hypothetical protein
MREDMPRRRSVMSGFDPYIVGGIVFLGESLEITFSAL